MKVTTTGTQKESQIVNFIPKPCQTMAYSVDYDSMQPEDTIRTFVSKIRGMVTKYETNNARISEIEAELVDLMHYIEMADNKRVADGYKLYRKVAELRRERRACKNENDLLQPIYDYFHATEVLNKLTLVQGECSRIKEAVDGRLYTIRTDILNDYLNPPSKKEPETPGHGMITGTPESAIETKKQYVLAWKEAAES